MKYIIIGLSLIVIFFLGFLVGVQGEPEIITATEYIEVINEVEIVREVIVEKEIYPTEFREFASQEELSRWQANQYQELRELGKQNNWVCVDYALELQRRAWLEGYQLSTENQLDVGGETGHAICSTWIGNNCYYLEPQGVISWLGATKAEGIAYTPAYYYNGEPVYRQE